MSVIPSTTHPISSLVSFTEDTLTVTYYGRSVEETIPWTLTEDRTFYRTLYHALSTGGRAVLRSRFWRLEQCQPDYPAAIQRGGKHYALVCQPDRFHQTYYVWSLEALSQLADL